MSHSVFKEFPATTTTTNNNNNIGSSAAPAPLTPTNDSRDNVVIVLNKDGSVSVDQHALHTFLRDDQGKTAVSVVRVQSPTPSLEEELREQGPTSDEEENEGSSNSNSDLDGSATDSEDDDDDDDNDTDDKDDDDDEEVDSAGKAATNNNKGGGGGGGNKRKKNRKQRERPPHVRLTVEQYLAPDQAKLFAAEILQYAGMSSGLSLDVDYDYQRFVVHNDHCYTPLTSPKKQQQQQQQHKQGIQDKDSTTTAPGTSGADKRSNNNNNNNNKLQSRRRPGHEPTNKSSSVVTSRRGRQIIKPNQLLDVDGGGGGGDDKGDLPEEEDEGDGESDIGEEEQEEQPQTDDEDYSVSESENDRDSDLDFRVNSNYLPKKKKKHHQQAHPSKASKGNATERETNRRQQQGHRESLTTTTTTAATAGAGATTGRKQRVSLNTAAGTSHLQQTKLPFKVATPTATQLQSQQQQRLQQRVKNQPQPPVNLPTTTTSSSSSQQAPKRVIIGGVAAAATTTAAVKQDPLYSDMSSLFATPDIIKKVVGATTTSSTGTVTATAIKPQEHQQLFELDLINSIVAEDNNTTTTTTTTTTSAMEPRKGGGGGGGGSGGDTLDLSDTSSLLDGIVGGDDGLPEELMQHVAELVENKSLQEVIDKQVLGVEDPMVDLMTNLLPTIQQQPAQPQTQQPQQQPPVKRESPFVKLAQQKQLARQSAAAAASLTAPRKEPIKIIRSDGRVITLPPIEAPTTRGAKRRAQNNPAEEKEQQQQHHDQQMVEILEEADVSAPVLIETPSPVSATRKKSGSERGSTSRRGSATPSVAESDMDMEFNSEDDPDRLWCICKQPHNNRFMICCDTCEDWFHGKCVSITKAMGQQMEAEGREWTCPNCVQGRMEQQNQKQNSQLCIVCRQRRAKEESVYCSDECIVRHANKTQHQQQQQQTVTVANPLQMPKAPSNATATPPPTGGEGKVRIGLLKNAQGRVIVYHKRTKQCLSGDNAPFLANIKEWLAQHPDYAIVAPGSEVAEAFKAKQAQLQQLKVRQMQQRQQQQEGEKEGEKEVDQGKSVQGKLKCGPNKHLVIVNPRTGQQQQQSQVKTPTTTTTTTTPQVKLPRKSLILADTVTTGSTGVQRPVQRGEVEPIRLTVRKTLQEHLAQRMQEVKEGSGAAKLSPAEIEQFALDTEQEMFALFNRDTGHKYKAKYRSLVFNVKDRKNETLFRRICEKAVRPYRLVRLSPEELASQELAQWRENEAKHQLEMIKKSELELLACAKRSFVLKTHKGEEEVLEDMMGGEGGGGGGGSVNDVDGVTMLSGMMGGGGGGGAVVEEEEERKRERKREREKHHRSHHSSSSSSSKHHHHHQQGHRDSHHHSHHHQHKRKRSRERSRDRKEREKSSRHKSSSSSTSAGGHGHKKDGWKKESRSGSSSHQSKTGTTTTGMIPLLKEESNHASSPASSSSSTQHHQQNKGGVGGGGAVEGTNSSSSSSSTAAAAAASHSTVFKPSKRETEESYDLIEKILQETSPELVAKLHEMEKQKGAKREEQEQQNVIKAEDDEEYDPASANPEGGDDVEEDEEKEVVAKGIWSGRVVYQETAQFHGVLQPLYGETADVLADFPATFEVQGRIGPEVVWEYLGKIKRSVNRDIAVVRFVPRTMRERAAYETMYSYFETKNRLGVLKPKSEVIKDFYLVPQRKGRLLPSVLLTLKGLGSYETKVNCIVGIVVKATLKRPGGGGGGGSSSKVARKMPPAVMVKKAEEGALPGSPKGGSGGGGGGHKLLTMGPLPTVVGENRNRKGKITTDYDDDAPYSPGGGSEADEEQEQETAAAATVAPAAPAIMPAELQLEVERLNRQIEAQKNEIVEMLAKDPLAEEEPYSPSRPVSSSSPKDPKVATIPLANISIPSNLQEILASLKGVGGKAPAQTRVTDVNEEEEEEEEDDDEEYNPVPISATTKLSTETYKPRPTSPSTRAFLLAQQQNAGEEIPFLSGGGSEVAVGEGGEGGPSKLSHMTDDELMRLVPDGVDLAPPPPPRKPQQQQQQTLGDMPPGLGDGNDEEYDPGQ